MNASVVFSQLITSFGINCTIFFVTLAAALPLGLLVAFGFRLWKSSQSESFNSTKRL